MFKRKNKDYHVYNTEEKKVANEIPVSVFADFYDAGLLTKGVILENGQIVGREN